MSEKFKFKWSLLEVVTKMQFHVATMNLEIPIYGDSNISTREKRVVNFRMY